MANGSTDSVIDPREIQAGRALVNLRRELREPKHAPEPENLIDSELERVAARVRRWREESGLTLQELARRSGVAASTIQKVETRQMVPTVAVLFKIARGLDRSPTEFVRESTDEILAVHLPQEQRHVIGLRERMLCERLVGDLFDPNLEAWRLTHEPGSGSGRHSLSHDGETLIIGESGRITFRVGEEEFVVGAGDILHFKCSLPHGWRNESDEAATFVSVGTLPHSFRASLHKQLKTPADEPAEERS